MKINGRLYAVRLLFLFWFSQTYPHELFAVFFWGHASVFLEHSGEMLGTVKPQKLCYVFYGQMGVEKIVPCSLHSHVDNKLGKGVSRMFFDNSMKLTLRVTESLCRVWKGNFAEIVVYVSHNVVGCV